MLKICVPVIIVFFISCSDSVKEKKEAQVASFPVKEMFIDTADGGGWGADLRLSIVKIIRTDTSTSYFLNSSSGKENIGFQLQFLPECPMKKRLAHRPCFSIAAEQLAIIL